VPHVWILVRQLTAYAREHAAAKLEHGVFVYSRQVLGTRHGQLDGRSHHLLTALTGDDPYRDSDIGGGTELSGAGDPVAVGWEALVVLPHDDHVDTLMESLHAWVAPGRADVGEEVEGLPKYRVR